MNIPPSSMSRANFVKGMHALSESTHAKFMKMIILEFPKFNGDGDPIYWIRQAEQFFCCHDWLMRIM